jgi:hypothetical protein
MPDGHPLRKFLIRVFALLPLCFALWTFASAALALPAVGFSNMIMTAWLPDIVRGLLAQGAEVIVVTHFGELNGQIVSAQQAGDALAFILNTRILSYSIPFYAALHFAVGGEKLWSRFFQGCLVLYVLLVFGLVSLALKELMVNLGTTFLEHPAAAIPHPNIIAVLYQLNVLIVPTLGPILIWAWQHRGGALFSALHGVSPADEDTVPD